MARQILSSAVPRASDAGNMDELTDAGGDKHDEPASQNDAQRAPATRDRQAGLQTLDLRVLRP
jgi:hypothetical protein